MYKITIFAHSSIPCVTYNEENMVLKLQNYFDL